MTRIRVINDITPHYNVIRILKAYQEEKTDMKKILKKTENKPTSEENCVKLTDEQLSNVNGGTSTGLSTNTKRPVGEPFEADKAVAFIISASVNEQRK